MQRTRAQAPLRGPRTGRAALWGSARPLGLGSLPASRSRQQSPGPPPGESQQRSGGKTGRPGLGSPRRGSGGSGLCPLSPGCPVKLPGLRRHFASASPARPPARRGGQPVSARRCRVLRRRWPQLVFIPALTETLSATTPAAGSATVALPRARTRGADRRGSPAAPATPTQRPRLPQAPGAERVWGAGRGGGRHLRRLPVALPGCRAEHCPGREPRPQGPAV